MVYANDKSQFDATQPVSGKPCFAVMGEFSVGKSTLCNLILGEPVLPTKVTATRLPPVWISKGDADPQRIDRAGNTHPLDLEKLDRINPDDTRYIKLYKSSELLEMCDLIDMPGISDPNMSYDGWDDIIAETHAVIWCTHATQAWRQSEAAMWSTLPDALKSRGVLLLTRFDKLTTDRDRARVIQRVEKETDGAFRGVYPISLTSAMDAGEDPDLLRECGAENMALGIVELLTEMGAVNQPA